MYIYTPTNEINSLITDDNERLFIERSASKHLSPHKQTLFWIISYSFPAFKIAVCEQFPGKFDISFYLYCNMICIYIHQVNIKLTAFAKFLKKLP